jgi:hypothetical protein
MFMSDQIKNILDDLYAIDPGLRNHEKTLVKLISELLAAKPDTKFDERVAGDLRRKVMAKADLLASERKSALITNMNFMKKLNFIFGGVAAVAVIFASVAYLQKNGTGNLITPIGNDNTEIFSNRQEVKSVSSNAFGNLALVNTGGYGRGGTGGGPSTGSGSASGGSASNPVAGAPEIDQQTKAVQPYGSGDVSILPAFEQYNYKYTGDDIVLEDSELDVYRRVKGLPAGASASQVLRSLNFGLMDMKKFSNTSVESINIVEDRDWGYNFYINFREGTMSIAENGFKWPTPDRQCKDDACYQSLRLNLSDIPADGELLAMADSFMKEHNIPTNAYGQPFVQNMWKQEYEKMADKSQFYVPDVVSVVYPLKVNGQEVFDEGGSKTGLSVNINVRVKRVSGLYELSSQRYEASRYAAETNTDRILQVAQRGGFRGDVYYGMPEGARTTTHTVELGTPTRSIVKFWMPSNDGLSNELLVPALVFPVTKGPEGHMFYRKTVVVPLVKEVLDSDTQYSGIRPMM